LCKKKKKTTLDEISNDSDDDIESFQRIAKKIEKKHQLKKKNRQLEVKFLFKMKSQ
jgi:hypothetical protein